MGKIFIFIHDFLYERMPIYKEFHEKIKSIVDKEGLRLNVLDVPTTTGNLSNLIAKTQTVTTIDISKESLAIALKKNYNITTKLFNAYESIPIQDNYFDCIISSHILYFLKEKNNLLSEYFRVLKPNGIMIISEFDSYKNIKEVLEISNHAKGVLSWKICDIVLNFINGISRKQYLTLNNLIDILDKHNFKVNVCEKTFGNLSNIILVKKRNMI